MPIKDENHIPALKRKIKQAKRSSIRVGILGDQEMALVGASNEFGAKIPISPVIRRLFAAKGFPLKKETTVFIIPERSWLRTSFDNKKNVSAVFKEGSDIYNLNVPLMTTLNRMGIIMTSFVQKKIRSNIKPKNHPFTTQEKKGKNKTLINSGRLVQGVTHKIKK